MKLFDRHILQDIAPTFVAGVVLFAGFIWIAGGPLLNAITDLSTGVQVWIVAQLAALFLPPMLVLAFPMAMLIAVIMAFSRFSSDSEAVAMFASGISFYRMLVPTAAFALFVTLIGLVINNSLIPQANRRINYIKANVTHELKQTTKAFDLPAQYSSSGVLQLLVHVEGGFDESTRALQKVTIVQFNSAGKPNATIFAGSAEWLGGDRWDLRDVDYESAGTVDHLPETTFNIRQTAAAIESLSSSADNYSFSELAKRIAILRSEGYGSTKELRGAEMSLWDKIAEPCATFVFALVAAPLALKPQRASSRSAATTYGILIILGYYAVFKYLDVLGTNGQIDPMFAAFLPNLLGVGLAGVLISRVTT